MTGRKTINADRERFLYPIIDAGVVAAGVDQGSAQPLDGTWCKVTSVPSGSGVSLPPAIIGVPVDVVRDDDTASHDLLVYPAPGDLIDDDIVLKLSGSIPSAATLKCIDGVWNCVSLLNVSRWPRAFPTLSGVAALALGAVARLLAPAGIGGVGNTSLGPCTLRSGSAGIGALAGSAALAVVTN